MKTKFTFLFFVTGLFFPLFIDAQEPEQCPCVQTLSAEKELITDNPFNSYYKRYNQNGRLTRTRYLKASANIFGVELYECYYTFDWIENVAKQAGGFVSSIDTLDLGKSIRYGWEPPTGEEDCGIQSFFFLLRDPGFWGNYPYDFDRGEWAGYADDEFLVSAIFRGIETSDFGEGTLVSVAQQGIDILKPLAKFRDCGLRKPNFEIYDANPEFITTGIFGGDVSNIAEITDATLLPESVGMVRSAVATDGVSEMLFKFRFSEQVNGRVELDSKYGSVEYPWASQSHEIGGSHFVFALYRPPDEFPEEEFKTKIKGVESVIVPFELVATNGEENNSYNFEITLVRPPVVLVHGTFDDPDNCWRTPISGQDYQSMTDRLEEEGFMVFTCDYRQTNGRFEVDRGPGFLTEEIISGFEKNKRVAFENEGGIKEAVEVFRAELNAAVTQVEAIGHSLGGVLIRVYASDQDIGSSYNTDYFRDNNFQQGDINRIITLSSTHHGSDMAAFHDFLERNQINTDLPLIEQLLNATTTFITYFAGIGTAQIVADQRPLSPALRKIGATPIPAHSVVCSVRDMQDISNNLAEENSSQGYNLFWKALTTLLYFNNNTIKQYIINLLEAQKRIPSDLKNIKPINPKFNSVSGSLLNEARKPSMREEFLEKFDFNLSRLWFIWHLFNEQVDDSWIETNSVYVTQYETTEINYGDFDDNLQVEIREGQWDLIRDEMLETFEVSDDESLANEVIDFFRYLIFKNAENDCTVRYESQTGGLNAPFITTFNQHLHSFVPRYPEIQDTVIHLLKSGNQFFDPDGFPEAGQLMPIELPDPSELNQQPLAFDDNPERTDCEAICWSGYVPAHARVFAQVADILDLVILARPVNPDATAVIAADNATKPMNLKGKSSNWGPQRALIAEDQRFSKIWFQYEEAKRAKRDSEVKKYNEEVVNSINDPADIAILRHLQKMYICDNVEQTYAVYFDTTISDVTKSIVMTADNSNYYRWIKEKDDPCDDKVNCCPLDFDNPVTNLNLKALNVLANPQVIVNSQPLFYTADYDLLAIGFYEKSIDGNEKDPYNSDKKLIPEFTQEEFDSERGFITDEQKALVFLLNKDVQEIAGYKGGNVTHHGPENQYYIAGKPDKGSPYVDYPIIVFEPDGSRFSKEGNIRAIPKGKPGFRDIYLKRYMAKMRRKGYNLYPNQVAVGWKWDHHHTYDYHKGWDDKDAAGLASGPEEIPFPKNCSCDDSQQNNQKILTPLSAPNMAQVKGEKLFPNPTLSIVNIELVNPVDQQMNYQIIDLSGIVVEEGEDFAPRGIVRKMLNISVLRAGFYSLVIRFENGQIITKKIVKENSN